MSFLDAYEGAEPPTATQRGEIGHEECSSVAGVVFQLTTNVASYKRMVDSLGTQKDSEQLRNRMHKTRDSIQQLARETSNRLKGLNNQAASGALSNTVKGTHAKLVKDFHSLLKDFQKTQRSCNERELMYTVPKGTEVPAPVSSSARVIADPELDERPSAILQPELEPLMQTQDRSQLIRLDNAIEYNSNMIRERDQDLADIQDEILEVNEIFQDLAVLVNEQGGMIEDIEANIVKTNVQVKQGHEQLKQAEKSQKSSRTKICCMLFFVIVVLIILLVVLMQLL